MTVTYRTQAANIQNVSEHLKRCDSTFIPMLSSRLDIDDYSIKILKNAKTFEAWIDDELIGLVAAYCNSSDQLNAYITSVSVLPDWQGKGLAAQLLTNCIVSVRNLGFEKIDLEVNAANKAAMALYLSHGFIATENESHVQKMTVNLTKDS